jgi:GT2 family glycosyltransferase
MLIRKNAFTSVGGFSEDFFLYFEETDFCLRLSDAGWVCMYDPSLSVCHGNPLQNRETPAHIRVYTRHSRMLYFKRNRPAYESFLMNIALFLEAIIRITINRFSGDWNQVLAWNLIMQLAVGFIKGSYPKGTSVRRLVSDSLHVG